MPEANLCIACPVYIVNWGGRGWFLRGSGRGSERPARALTHRDSAPRRSRTLPFMPTEQPPPPLAPASAGTTVIVGGNEETRLLLRGLLRLYHYRVEGEVPRAELLRPAESPDRERVLILVVDGRGEEWSKDLSIVRERQPGAQLLLIAQGGSASLEATARSAGVRGILYRPFGIRDLITTVEAVGRGEERFGPRAPQR
jgi:hypothetical protein